MTRTDLTVFLSGAAVALTAGVLLGGAMQPHLASDDGRPAGPQMFAAYDGRSTGPFDPGDPYMTLAAYHGAPPDYVMGTDWKKAMAPPVEKTAVAEPRDAPDDPPPPILTHVVYDEPPPTHDYPSMGGSHPSVIELPAPADETEPAPDAGR
ncbi:hypothetical protein [Phenylobacterium sp.]|jgi:hypothetical protein|uniref:hypothetical protein n=1 Tax=Phenylobacterium sp. TaxID=1871053 RepID=UPI002E363799|nr:hypothetical protein [Phenylobacterium sp.]HEX3367668.1 hypothetical protein [Phenylobacterium sp.]